MPKINQRNPKKEMAADKKVKLPVKP